MPSDTDRASTLEQSAGVPTGGKTPLDVSVVIPTRNAEPFLHALLARLDDTLPAPRRILFIDSGSTDQTQPLIQLAGHSLQVIDPSTFGHGRTRNVAVSLCPDSRYIVFLTQDAVPVGCDWLARLLAPFGRPDVAVAYGRQLPRPEATESERFARAFNYPDRDEVTAEHDIKKRGVKAVFCSNSFAAYDRERLVAVGGFPEDLPLGEDMAVTMRLLERGYARFYCASAMVVHSHNYTLKEEFRRYFDIGVLLSCDEGLKRAELVAAGEGRSFIRAELDLAWTKRSILRAVHILVRAAAKFVGFQLGRRYRRIPPSLCRRMSLHTYYWQSS